MAYYKERSDRTPEEIEEYVRLQVDQMLKIEKIFDLNKNNPDFDKSIEVWIEKSNEELDEYLTLNT